MTLKGNQENAHGSVNQPQKEKDNGKITFSGRALAVTQNPLKHRPKKTPPHIL